MKIVHSDDLEAREGGSLTVVMEESDDLWVLYNLVDPDDTVRCGTLRKVNKSDKAGAKAATEKRRVTLSVRAIASEYDGIADVAVIGVPSEQWGETVKALIVRADPDLSEEAAIAYARTQLAGYKIPRSVDWVDTLPRNPSGKVLKVELRKPYWEGRHRRVN